jgi:hypothetical protein
MPTASKPAKARKPAAKKAAPKKAAAPKAAAKPAEPKGDNFPSADPPTLELPGQRPAESIEDQAATLIQDKQDSEPALAVGGAELAGAQIASNERDPMVAQGTAAPTDG